MTGMENTASDRFAVVQDVYQLKDWQVAAALLAEVLGLPAVTANQQARRSRGFLATKLSVSLAQQLQKACAAHGIAVQVVPQSEVFPVVKLPRRFIESASRTTVFGCRHQVTTPTGQSLGTCCD